MGNLNQHDNLLRFIIYRKAAFLEMTFLMGLQRMGQGCLFLAVFRVFPVLPLCLNLLLGGQDAGS